MKKLVYLLLVLVMINLVCAFELRVTNEHPFFVDDSWIPASALNIGDELMTASGERIRITSIKDVFDDVEVYNLHVDGTNDFFANDVLVHNKAFKNNPYVSEIKCRSVGTTKEWYIDTPNGEVPVPDPEKIPVFDREEALEDWVDIGFSPELRAARRKAVDNIDHIPFEDFQSDLGKAVDEFNDYIGDEPYVAVFLDDAIPIVFLDDAIPNSGDIIVDGKSPSWVYDLASLNLKKKPVGFLFLRESPRSVIKNPISKYFESGIRKFVLFDDAAYSGSQLRDEFGNEILDEFDGFSVYMDHLDKPLLNPQVEVIGVLAKSTLSAEDRFLGLSTRTGKPVLIKGGEIKEAQDIFTPEEFELLESRDGLTEYDTFTFFDHKVPDELSLYEKLSNYIFLKGTKIKFRDIEETTVPYKIPDTPFKKRWECILKNPNYKP